jgi:hypothetical protein
MQNCIAMRPLSEEVPVMSSVHPVPPLKWSIHSGIDP